MNAQTEESAQVCRNVYRIFFLMNSHFCSSAKLLPLILPQQKEESTPQVEDDEDADEGTEEMPAELPPAADLWKAKRQSEKSLKKLVKENIKLKDELVR